MDCRDKILSNDYYDVLTDFTRQITWDIPEICYANVNDIYNVVYIDRFSVPNSNVYFYDYKSLPKLYGLMQAGNFDPASLIASGISQVQREPLGLTGKGVIVCIIDTGIDYTKPVFRNDDGTSRVLAIWDQTVQTGEPPSGFQYGTEFTREEINDALLLEDPYTAVPSRDEIGHGTTIAEVAAGGDGVTYVGAAPSADILVVKLKECKQYFRDFYLIPQDVPAYQENDIMLAVQYADTFVKVFSRPVVICIALGTSYGDHAGNAMLSRYLNFIAVRRSRAVVVAGGNEGNARHHFHGRLDRGGSGGAASVEVRVDTNVSGFLLELWGNIPDIFTLSVRAPGGETIAPVQLGIRESITYGFVYERSKVTIAGMLVEPASGEELILLRVQDPTPGIWNFRVEAAGEIYNGEFHLWLPISQFLDAPVYFLESSPYITLTGPAMAADVISVSTYDAANNSFYIDSGRGFSRTGAIRPDFAAPGVSVSTTNGRESGSSLAAAVTAGAVAQFMQWAVVQGNNKLVESREIKNYFIRGASRNFDMSYPSREWGYGRLNISGTFEAISGI